MTILTLIALNSLVAEDPPDDVTKLADSIACDGLQEPLTVTPEGDGYRVVHGKRRLKAIRSLFVKDDTVYDPEHHRFSLGKTLYREVPCEVL